MRIIALLIGTVSLLVAGPCLADRMLDGASKHASSEIDPARGLYVSGVITGGALSTLQAQLDAMVANQADSSPITIAIDSPGGEVVSGMKFVSSMRAAQGRGIRIDCYVTGMAASMAFMILTQCDTRRVLDTSFLLWHGVRVGTNQPITAALAASLASDLAQTDELIISMLDDSLSINHTLIMKHFNQETLWSGVSLNHTDHKFLTKVTGTYPKLNRVLTKFTRPRAPSLLDLLFGGELYIMSDKVFQIYATNHVEQ